MIERNIFQTWKAKVSVPDNFKHWSQSVKKQNPDCCYYFWDDKENRDFVRTCYPWFLEIYDGYPAEIYRVDAIRYLWLYHFGGIYIDMDSECLRPLDELFRTRTGVVLGRMGRDETFVHSIPNAVMMSTSRERFWLYVVHLLMSSNPVRRNPEDVTGSIVLKAAVNAFQDGNDQAVTAGVASVQALMPKDLWPADAPTQIELLPPACFFPIDWSDPVHQVYFRKKIIREGQLLSRAEALELFPNSYIATYWAHSWDYPDR